jgi:asparagine synthase (glutamine-hydrolysing)
MCGITGFVGAPTTATNGDALACVARKMSDCIRHRGPDDGGEWVDASAGVAFGFRRLSIIDLSPAGHQPMLSASGRFVLVFNGEIYNYEQIRRELERAGAAPEWRGHSDTEVMLAAFERWGVREALQRFNGMFAFALWDRRDRTLYLSRDRLGEKPLYYGWMGPTFLFGSELKALRAHPAWRGEIDRGALALYMRHNYVPAPYSIYAGIAKLPPAGLLTLAWADGAPGREPKVDHYWSAHALAEAAAERPYAGTEGEALEELDVLLRDAVAIRMHADVPLGAFLSGGVDSSAIVALMQAQSPRPVRTFSIGNTAQAYNEAPHAKVVAAHLGTDHTELYVTSEDGLAVIPRLPSMYDEPFADSSQIPTFLVSALARRHVTVSLSGDGGDELFGGYNRYFWGRKIWRSVGWVPRRVRAAMASGLRAVSPRRWDALAGRVAPLVPASVPLRRIGDNAHKLAGILATRDPIEMYRGLVTHWEDPSGVIGGSVEHSTVLTDRSRWPRTGNFTRHMMALDLVTYLPDDILVKVDRASMAVSLEARVPFLDYRVVEFAGRLPLSMKIRGNTGKLLLRRLLFQYVPQPLIDRPKMGFGVPVDDWLRGPLREWAESLLDPDRLRREGFIAHAPVRERWNQHLSGRSNWSYLLWDVLMFQAWLDEQRAS